MKRLIDMMMNSKSSVFMPQFNQNNFYSSVLISGGIAMTQYVDCHKSSNGYRQPGEIAYTDKVIEYSLLIEPSGLVMSDSIPQYPIFDITVVCTNAGKFCIAFHANYDRDVVFAF